LPLQAGRTACLKKEAGVLHQGALPAHGDRGLWAGFNGALRGILVEALVDVRDRGKQAGPPLGDGLCFRIGGRGSAENFDGDQGVHHRLVARVVDLQHDICAEGLERIEQDRAGMDAEMALALVEHDVVLLQIH
jgi:hypothetical protein